MPSPTCQCWCNLEIRQLVQSHWAEAPYVVACVLGNSMGCVEKASSEIRILVACNVFLTDYVPASNNTRDSGKLKTKSSTKCQYVIHFSLHFCTNILRKWNVTKTHLGNIEEQNSLLMFYQPIKITLHMGWTSGMNKLIPSIWQEGKKKKGIRT